MAAGLGVLRLAPRDFWAMTLPELAAALRGAGGQAGGGEMLSRENLEALIALYPDQQEQRDV